MREYLTIEELAARWRCNKMTIRNKMKAGELSYYKMGHRVLFDLFEIEEIEKASKRNKQTQSA